MTKTRWRRRFLSWLPWLATGAAIIFAMVLVGWNLWALRNRSLLVEEFGKIQTSGEPLTTEQMVADFQTPASPDATDVWLAALAPFADRERQIAVKDLVGKGLPTALDQPLASPAGTAAFAETNAQDLGALHAAARTPGEVCFQRRFDLGHQMPLDEAESVRAASFAAALEFQHRARGGNIDGAIESIETLAALSRTLRREPVVIVMMVRIATQALTLRSMRQLAVAAALSDEQLLRLYQCAETLDIERQVHDAFIGERAMALHGFSLPLELLSSDGRAPLESYQLETSFDANRIARPADCAMCLHLISRMATIGHVPLHQNQEAVEQVDAEIQGLMQSKLVSLSYVQTLLYVPPVKTVFENVAKSVAEREITLGLLAAKRYALREGRPPKSYWQLHPNFIPEVPADPFGGGNLLFRAGSNSVTIYSRGPDRVDDGGQCDPDRLTPDIAFDFRF